MGSVWYVPPTSRPPRPSPTWNPRPASRQAPTKRRRVQRAKSRTIASRFALGSSGNCSTHRDAIRVSLQWRRAAFDRHDSLHAHLLADATELSQTQAHAVSAFNLLAGPPGRHWQGHDMSSQPTVESVRHICAALLYQTCFCLLPPVEAERLGTHSGTPAGGLLD